MSNAKHYVDVGKGNRKNGETERAKICISLGTNGNETVVVTRNL
jgi:hypothetical protein